MLLLDLVIKPVARGSCTAIWVEKAIGVELCRPLTSLQVGLVRLRVDINERVPREANGKASAANQRQRQKQRIRSKTRCICKSSCSRVNVAIIGSQVRQRPLFSFTICTIIYYNHDLMQTLVKKM